MFCQIYQSANPSVAAICLIDRSTATVRQIEQSAAAVFQIDLPDIVLWPTHSPLILLRLHTRITVHAQTAAQQQSNGNC